MHGGPRGCLSPVYPAVCWLALFCWPALLRYWHAWLFTGVPGDIFSLQWSGLCLLRQEQAAAPAAARPGRPRHVQQSVRLPGEDEQAANHGEWLSSRICSHSCWTWLHGGVAMAATRREALHAAHVCVTSSPIPPCRRYPFSAEGEEPPEERLVFSLADGRAGGRGLWVGSVVGRQLVEFGQAGSCSVQCRAPRCCRTPCGAHRAACRWDQLPMQVPGVTRIHRAGMLCCHRRAAGHSRAAHLRHAAPAPRLAGACKRR